MIFEIKTAMVPATILSSLSRKVVMVFQSEMITFVPFNELELAAQFNCVLQQLGILPVYNMRNSFHHPELRART